MVKNLPAELEISEMFPELERSPGEGNGNPLQYSCLDSLMDSTINSNSFMNLLLQKPLPIYNGNPLQYSCLENPTDRGTWKAAVHGVAEGWTRLSDFPFTFHFHALEKEMATHSSVLAWRIPGTGEPGGLPSMGLHRIRHD